MRYLINTLMNPVKGSSAMNYVKSIIAAAIVGTFALPAVPAFAHGSGHGQKKHDAAAKHAEETPFGRAGDPKKAARTVNVDMNDTMRFDPASITVREGETVRFRVKNSGKVLHEIVLGTMEDLKAHAELMRKFPNMEHDEPHMAHVEPGKSGELVWQFTKAGQFYFACLIPGHFEAGMVGTLVVEANGKNRRAATTAAPAQRASGS
jgi:uncharacterized cupredoxin-like copper-binding protein